MWAGGARCARSADAASRRREVRRGTGAHQGVGAGCGAAVVRANSVRFCVVENPPSLWHFVPEWPSFSVNDFVVLFMNNYEYKPDVLKQLNSEYNMNNIHISGQKRYSNGADTRDKRKERRTLHD